MPPGVAFISGVMSRAMGFARGYKYSALPSEASSTGGRRRQRADLAPKYRRALKLIIAGISMFVALLIVASARASRRAEQPLCDTVDSGFVCNTSISESWGQYSPFFSVPSEISTNIPDTCTLTFAQVLSRHGARDPTSSKTEKYSALIAKIQAKATSYGAGFEFIKGFEYTLGSDQLTTFGQQELVNSGIKFYKRYLTLANANTPFIRASGSDRVIQSAENFTQGFHLAKSQDPKAADDSFPYDILIVPEDDGSNNTMHHGLCTNFEEGTNDNAEKTWAHVFVPDIQARINDNLPGANLSLEETIALMDMCPFTTVANTAGTLTQFCDLFTEDEWASYGYYETLDKWYGYGPGNPLGPTQGVGYVNELLARLTNTSVEDSTSTNHTLDSSQVTFPLGLSLYADFSHDNDMTAIFSAMGVFDGVSNPSNTTRQGANESGGFSAAYVVPFSARMYVEKMICYGSEEEMVRVLLNDRVVPMRGCGSDELGRCKLGAFVESMSFARDGGLWDQCFT